MALFAGENCIGASVLKVGVLFLRRFGGVTIVSAVRVGSGHFAPFVPRRQVLGRITQMTDRVGQSLRKAGPLFLDMLGNTFVFTTSLVHGLAVPDRVSFIGLTSCTKASSAKGMGRLMNLGSSVRNHAIIVIRSVISAKIAVGRLLRALRTEGPGRVHVTALLLGPSGLGIRLSVRCITVHVPGSFVIKCNLSCSNLKHGCQSVCAMVR